jgi:hypothetical protein
MMNGQMIHKKSTTSIIKIPMEYNLEYREVEWMWKIKFRGDYQALRGCG